MENINLGTVKIIADKKTGLVINMFPNNDKGEAYFTIEQKGVSYFDAKGYLREPLRTMRLRGKFDSLVKMNYKENQEFGGTIIRKDSFTPFYAGQKPTMNPNTGINVLKEGKEVYFQYAHVNVLDAKDYWVEETPTVSTTPKATVLAAKLITQE